MSHQYYIIYKPFGMLSQFSQSHGKPILGDLYNFPKDVYPVGRLDADSEGLLILTNDKYLNHKLLNPKFGHNRTYWVQVDNEATSDAIDQLKKGVEIKLKTQNYHTKPAEVRKIDLPENLPERNPPVRFRKNIPTSWIELTLKEGKNRQVRKMTAKVGFPTLRLIRKKIVNLDLNSMQPGDVLEIDKATIYKKLNIK